MSRTPTFGTWRTRRRYPAWDRPMYGEFFRAVRDPNLSPPQTIDCACSRRPRHWEVTRRINEGPASEQRERSDHGIWVARRSQSPTVILLWMSFAAKCSPGRRALLFGEGTCRIGGRWLVASSLRWYKSVQHVNATENYDALRTLFPDVQSWPVPRAVLTPPGAFSSGPFTESDAVLYLGSPSALTESKLPAALCADVGYLSMRRERMRWAGMPENTAEQLLARDCPK